MLEEKAGKNFELAQRAGLSWAQAKAEAAYVRH
jgi:hypothetical protein